MSCFLDLFCFPLPVFFCLLDSGSCLFQYHPSWLHDTPLNILGQLFIDVIRSIVLATKDKNIHISINTAINPLIIETTSLFDTTSSPTNKQAVYDKNSNSIANSFENSVASQSNAAIAGQNPNAQPVCPPMMSASHSRCAMIWLALDLDD